MNKLFDRHQAPAVDSGRNARCPGYLVGLPALNPSPGEWICFLVEPLDGGGRANS